MFRKELLEIYLAVKHFFHLLEGSDFMIFIDHKPPTFTLLCQNELLSPRETRHLDYILKFTSDICHIADTDNIPADALFHLLVDALLSSVSFDLVAMATGQSSSDYLDMSSSQFSCCKFEHLPLPFPDETILCDVSTGSLLLLVPENHRHFVFEALHSLSHSSIESTVKLILVCFSWPNMQWSITAWSHACLPYQHSKVHCHMRAPLVHFQLLDTRFYYIHIDLVGPWPVSSKFIFILTCIV